MRMNRRFASNEASRVRAISRLAAKQLAVTHVSTGTVDIPLDGTEGGDMAARRVHLGVAVADAERDDRESARAGRMRIPISFQQRAAREISAPPSAATDLALVQAPWSPASSGAAALLSGRATQHPMQPPAFAVAGL